MQILFKDKNLVIDNEDQVLEILGLWYRHHYAYADIDGMLDKIRWQFVTLDGLMRVINSAPELKDNRYF